MDESSTMMCVYICDVLGKRVYLLYMHANSHCFDLGWSSMATATFGWRTHRAQVFGIRFGWDFGTQFFQGIEKRGCCCWNWSGKRGDVAMYTIVSLSLPLLYIRLSQIQISLYQSRLIISITMSMCSNDLVWTSLCAKWENCMKSWCLLQAYPRYIWLISYISSWLTSYIS